jgi:hypothetical protein
MSGSSVSPGRGVIDVAPITRGGHPRRACMPQRPAWPARSEMSLSRVWPAFDGCPLLSAEVS